MNKTLKIITGVVLIVTGILLAPFTGGASLSLTAYGLNLVAGVIFAPKEPKTLQQDSPTYGFRGFSNPVVGDSAIPVVYSNDTSIDTPGHKLAPIYVAAATTPRGYEDYDFAKALKARGQSVSMLLAVAEGPIIGLEDIRLNDEPVFQKHVNVKPAEKANGTRKTFTITGRRIMVDTFEVSVAGTAKGWIRATREEQVAVYRSTSPDDSAWALSLQDYDGGLQVIDDTRECVYYLGAVRNSSTRLSSTSQYGINAWMSDDRRTLYMNLGHPLPQGTSLWVDLPIKRTVGFRILRADDGQSVTLSFDTAPASGAEILVSYLRKVMPGVRADWRNGAAHQLAMAGHDAIRKTESKGVEITSSSSSMTTTTECDDVVIDIASQGEFTAYDNKDGGRSPVNAQIRIEWKLASEADSAYRKLRDPSETATSKTLYEFRLGGDSTSTINWSLSVRELLRRWVEDHPGDKTAAAELLLWTRNRYTVRVTRTNAIQNATSTYVRDRIDWVSITTTIEERLSYPGTAMLSIHGVGSERLQGSLPRVTARVIGLRDVEAYVNGAWTKGEAYQTNRVWAAIDFITARRYGGGEQFTKAANIDTTSAVTAAAWCEETVKADGVDETRSLLSYVADTRQPLMEQVRAILAPAQIIPIMEGNVWKFVIDKPVDLTTVSTIYCDGTDGKVLRATANIAHQEITSEATELQITYLDRHEDFQRREVWVAPKTPATNRRVERATAFGVDRASEARRYAEFLHSKMTNQGLQVSWAMIPHGLPFEAGDVVRLISTRLGLDLYVRILRWTLRGTQGKQLYIECAGAQYVPAAYGQTAPVTTTAPAAQALPVTGPTAAAPDGGPVGGAKVQAKIRRVA